MSTVRPHRSLTPLSTIPRGHVTMTRVMSGNHSSMVPACARLARGQLLAWGSAATTSGRMLGAPRAMASRFNAVAIRTRAAKM